MDRDNYDVKRNSIVSIFLRNFESYPGIIFLTTNRLHDFDEGILDRIHLKLRYPRLTEAFTEMIFNDHFARIEQSCTPAGPLSSGEQGLPRYQFKVKEADQMKIHKWWKEQFRSATTLETGNAGWWNGRQIRVNVQMASAFAEQERKTKGKDIAKIKKRHFEKVLAHNTQFRTDLANARLDRPDAPDQEQADASGLVR